MSAAGAVAPRRRRIVHRLAHYLVIAMVGSAIMGAVFFGLPGDDFLSRASTATAYGGFVLLGATLLTGPWSVLRSRPNPVSVDLRRDLGISAAVLGLAHVVLGLQVHLRGQMIEYFLTPPGEDGGSWAWRTDAFGWANDTGLVAGLLIALLAALSNDLALRRLGGRRWKAWQRANYAIFALVVLHGVLYQVLEKRPPPLLVVFPALVVVVLGMQGLGYRRLSTSSRSGPASRGTRTRPS